MTLYPALLPAIQLTSGVDNRIIWTEGGVDYNIDLPTANPLFLRGDGAADDLCLAIKTAVEAATPANTYTVTIARSTLATGVTGTITIARATGAATFGIKWASSTFTSTLLGWPSANISGSTSYASSLSPALSWVSNEIYEALDIISEHDAAQSRALSGRVWGSLRGGPYDVRSLSMAFIVAKRAHSVFDLADPYAGLDKLIARCLAGVPVELHLATASGTTLAALSSSTEHGAAWYLAADEAGGYAPARLSPGVPLYSARLRLLGKV